MEIANLLVLSTGHLHPLEANKLKELAYFYHPRKGFVVCAGAGMCKVYEENMLLCLVSLITQINEMDKGIDCILFEVDGPVGDEFPQFEWEWGH
jgi:hypothetical protein